MVVNVPLGTLLDDYSGDIYIGETTDLPSQDVFIEHSSFLRHALIVGSTGSGKTTTASHIAKELSDYGHVVVLDWHGEYSRLLRDSVTYVPSKKTPIPIAGRDVQEIVQVFEEVLSLSPPQAYLLERSIGETPPNSISEIIRKVDRLSLDARWVLESKLALIRKLNSVNKYTYRQVFSGGLNHELINIMNSCNGRVLIFDLSVLKDISVRKLASLFMLKFIEYVKFKGALSNDVFVILEEAHNVAGENSRFLTRMLAEVRKLGIGLIVISQSPSFLGVDVVANTNVRIIHAMKSKEDMDLMIKSLGATEVDLHKIIPRLRVGEAVLDIPGRAYPVIVRVRVNHP